MLSISPSVYLTPFIKYYEPYAFKLCVLSILHNLQRLAEFLCSQQFHNTKQRRCSERYQRWRWCLKGFGAGGRKVPAKTNAFYLSVVLQFNQLCVICLGYIVYFIISEGKNAFSRFPQKFTPPMCRCTKNRDAHICASQPYPLQIEKRINEGTKRGRGRRGWRVGAL